MKTKSILLGLFFPVLIVFLGIIVGEKWLQIPFPNMLIGLLYILLIFGVMSGRKEPSYYREINPFITSVSSLGFLIIFYFIKLPFLENTIESHSSDEIILSMIIGWPIGLVLGLSFPYVYVKEKSEK